MHLYFRAVGSDWNRIVNNLKLYYARNKQASKKNVYKFKRDFDV